MGIHFMQQGLAVFVEAIPHARIDAGQDPNRQQGRLSGRHRVRRGDRRGR